MHQVPLLCLNVNGTDSSPVDPVRPDVRQLAPCHHPCCACLSPLPWSCVFELPFFNLESFLHGTTFCFSWLDGGTTGHIVSTVVTSRQSPSVFVVDATTGQNVRCPDDNCIVISETVEVGARAASRAVLVIILAHYVNVWQLTKCVSELVVCDCDTTTETFHDLTKKVLRFRQ